MKQHGYTLDELNNMLPYEREIYVTILLNRLEAQEQERRRQS